MNTSEENPNPLNKQITKYFLHISKKKKILNTIKVQNLRKYWYSRLVHSFSNLLFNHYLAIWKMGLLISTWKIFLEFSERKPYRKANVSYTDLLWMPTLRQDESSP